MIISKIYNQTNKNQKKAGDGSSSSTAVVSSSSSSAATTNNRILTPSSIPIFILPPTLDNFSVTTPSNINSKSNDGIYNLKIINYFIQKLTYLLLLLLLKIESLVEREESNNKNVKKKNNNIYQKHQIPKIKSFDHHQHNHLRPNNNNKSKLPHTNSNNSLSNTNNSNSFNEELKNKENYCNFWVMASSKSCDYNSSTTLLNISNNDKLSMNGSIKSNEESKSEESNKILNKSTSSYLLDLSVDRHHIDEEYLNKAKEEEKLQREYLVNLLKQLESEQDNNNNNSIDNNNDDHLRNNEISNNKNKSNLLGSLDENQYKRGSSSRKRTIY